MTRLLITADTNKDTQQIIVGYTMDSQKEHTEEEIKFLKIILSEVQKTFNAMKMFETIFENKNSEATNATNGD